jgi:hypothetical protein
MCITRSRREQHEEPELTTRIWPTREEWAAKAEYSVRTVCYTSQRVSRFPMDWLTEEQFLDARRLVEAIVKATRREINRAVRETPDNREVLGYRLQLNAAARGAKALYLEVNKLAQDWSRIATVAGHMGAAPEEAAKLSELCAEMLKRRDTAAQADLDAAIEREIAKRNSDEGWAAELERRASIEAGPRVTRH